MAQAYPSIVPIYGPVSGCLLARAISPSPLMRLRSDLSMVREVYSPTGMLSEGSIVRQVCSQKGL